MNLLSINFIGTEDWKKVVKNIGGTSTFIPTNSYLDTDFKAGAVSGAGEEIVGLASNLNHNFTDDSRDAGIAILSPLKRIIDNSIGNATPGQIQLPKYDDSEVEKILRYAAPNLTNDDYYPEKTVNSIIGSASNKTLGTFPIFSSAALAPAGLWDKRRRAIGDYMLALEQAKTSKSEEPNWEFTPSKGANPLIHLNNNVAIERHENLYNKAKSLGHSARNIMYGGHPENEEHNQIMSDMTYNESQINENDKLVDALHTDLKSLDNSVGSKALEAAEVWNHISTLPENAPVEIGEGANKMKWNSKKEFFESQTYKDIAAHTGRILRSSNDILSLADNRAKQIEKNIMEESGITSKNENYFTFLKNKIATKYPLVQDASGNWVPNTDKYLNDIADQIISSRKNLFKKDDKDENADYTKEDLIKILESNIGIERSKNDYVTGVPGAGAGSSTNTVNAAPQYVKGVLEKLSRGEVIQGKSGKSNISSGSTYTMYITNGQMKLVPNGDVVENAKAIAEAGGADNEYGSVDAPTAIVQMNTGADADKIYSEFKNARKSIANERYTPNPNDSYQQRFNNSLHSFAGDNGAPIAGGDDIWITRMQSMADNKGDSKFYFELKDKSSKVPTKGVVIPKEKAIATVENPDAGIWNTYGFGDNKVKMFVPKGQDAIIIDGAYYHYNPPSKDNVASYTIYDKKTGHEYMFPGKSSTDSPYSITLPEYYVKNILGTPEKLVNEANKSYTEDKETPNQSQMTTVGTVKTKTGGKGQTMTIENGKTKEQRATDYFIRQGYSKEAADRFVQQYKTSTDPALKKQWNEF